MSKKIKKNFLVVDASSFLYRAYHAMPDLRNKKDFPTGAITGMINMLRKTREEWPAEIGLCVFDPKDRHSVKKSTVHIRQIIQNAG